jgi:uncharacterized membrane protein
MHEMLLLAVDLIIPPIQMVGVAIVVWAVVEALVRIVRHGWQVAAQRTPSRDFYDIRLAIGRKMVLSLEFFIASDIIQTVAVPTWESLGILAGIVAIRTVIVYFLEYEMRTEAKAEARE